MVSSPRALARLPDSGRFVALDSWRGLAAVGVAVHHLRGPGPLLTGPLHDNLGAAVDFFFVLSGFVIAAAYGARLAQGFSILRFMILRVGRVWPLHAVMVGLYLLLELGYAAWGGGGIAGRAPFTGARDPWALIPVILFLQEYVYPARDLWNVQSWSISVELGLYLGAALLWRLASKAAPVAALMAGALAIAILDVGSAGAAVNILRGIAGFGLGAAAWSVFHRLPAGGSPFWSTVLEAGLAGAALIAIAAAAPIVITDGVFVALVLVFARERGAVSRLLRTSPFVWLGMLSYSLYMTHGMVFGRVMDVLGVIEARLGVHWVDNRIGGVAVLALPPFSASGAAVAMLAAALVASWIAWRVVEWPAREWSRRYARRLGVRHEEATAPTI